jgi:hypothetical protein
LCARQRSSISSTACSAPRAQFLMWWNSSPLVEEQRRPLPSMNAQRAPSRFHTARFTAAGMCRLRFSAAFSGRGRFVTPAFRASVFSCSPSIARATIAAGSRPTLCASKSWSSVSFSCVASSTVTRISYRRGDSGATTAGLRARSGARTSSPTPTATAGFSGASARRCGTATIRDGTSGRGAISATSFSRSRLLRCLARPRSSP